jgi:MerR family transcriptional regulator, light-induced transcriptional regulator
VNEASGYLRIGELSRRTGVSPELLRAWERRYGLLHPIRSPGGYRLYSDADERRVRQTAELIGEGWSAAEAARGTLEATREPQAFGPAETLGPSFVADVTDRLRSAVDTMDAERAHLAFDELLSAASLESAMRDVLVPYLREVGERWAAGELSVGQEHFATNLIRGRLLSLARGWGSGPGPSAVLACPPGEAHDLGLIMFGLVLARRGWRVTFLGADTPFESLRDAAVSLRPSLIVLAVTDRKRARRHAEDIATLAAVAPVAIGGSITDDDAARAGARRLAGDPVSAALAAAA